MKKCMVCLLLFAFLFTLLSACQKDEGIPTYLVSEETESEETTQEGETLLLTEDEYHDYILSQITPSHFDQTLSPIELPKKVSEIDFSSCSVITAQNSYITDSQAQTIYSDGINQYFMFSSDTCFALLSDSADSDKRSYFYSAYYHEGGDLFCISNDNTSWYYNDTGEIYLIVYTCITDTATEISNFYNADGERLGIKANGLFYNNRLDQMSNEEYLDFIQKIGAVAELVE